MNINKVFLVFFCLLTTLSNGQEAYNYTQPQQLDDGWKTSSLRSEEIDSTLIYKVFDQLAKVDHKLHSVVLVKDNKIVLEQYYRDEAIDKPHDLRSTSKSIRSILLGIAIDKGFIKSIDDPISKYLKSPVPKKNLDPRKGQITIKHLITMSSGLDCNDWDKKSKGQEDRVYKKKDWLQYTLDLPIINEPGEVSNYCSMGVILMTEIISRASGMSIIEFADKYLFEPLDIRNVQWGHTSNKKVIDSGKRLYMITRDVAKIGQLILNEGLWNNTRVVSSNWIKEATSPKTKITQIDYGYLWWNIPFKVNDQIINSKVATGNGGQYIMVIPDYNLVAAFTGGAYNSQDDKLPFSIMNNVFLPSIKKK